MILKEEMRGQIIFFNLLIFDNLVYLFSLICDSL